MTAQMTPSPEGVKGYFCSATGRLYVHRDTAQGFHVDSECCQPVVLLSYLTDLAAKHQELKDAAFALLEQIEVEIGPCDGSADSRLWPTANGIRAALGLAEATRRGRHS